MSGQELQDMDLAAFGRWEVKSLKDFLRRRGLKVTGNKSTLMARAFSAWELNVPEVADLETQERKRAELYHQLLETTDEGVLPDPFTDVSTWLGEEEGIHLWPPIMLNDISDYLRKHEQHEDTSAMKERLLKDYKSQKAYSYFSSQWLFEVKYHEVSPKYRFLSTMCRPSQRINHPPHELWVCATSDGEIVSAYCTCFAGLEQSCNHVAALLLKVDFCWRYGMQKKACTSLPCVWNVGGGHKLVEPKKISDMEWRKPSATRLEQEKTTNPVARALFNPTEKTTAKGMSISDFLERLSLISPTSVVLKEMREKESKPSSHQSSDELLPKPIRQVAEEAATCEQFLASLPSLSVEDRRKIEEKTRGQSKCQIWYTQREGSLTASMFRDVYTKIDREQNGGSVCMASVLSRILGETAPPSDLPALKYGRRMESLAITKYVQILKESGHKKVTCTPCGLFTLEDKPYIRATPDSSVSCACCGNGLVEVKCPLKTSNAKPCPETVDCLEYTMQGEMRLKERHKYYDQVVGQIMVAERDWCDFFVFSMFSASHDLKLWKDGTSYYQTFNYFSYSILFQKW